MTAKGEKSTEELPDREDATEEHPLDELAKGLAGGTISRGKALKFVGAGILGTLTAGLIPGVAEAKHHHRHHHHHRRGGGGGTTALGGTCTSSSQCVPGLQCANTPSFGPLGGGIRCCLPAGAVCNTDSDCCVPPGSPGAVCNGGHCEVESP